MGNPFERGPQVMEPCKEPGCVAATGKINPKCPKCGGSGKQPSK